MVCVQYVQDYVCFGDFSLGVFDVDVFDFVWIVVIFVSFVNVGCIDDVEWYVFDLYCLCYFVVCGVGDGCDDGYI